MTTHSKISTLTETKPLFATDYHIYINHTDAGGIVYHANHLVFFENCRRDWFTKLNLSGYFLQTDDGQIQHFVVSQAQLQYRKAILLDEIISVRIDKVELKPASIIFHQSIHRQPLVQQAPDKVDTLLSSAKIVIACVQNQLNPTQSETTAAHTAPIRPVRVPKSLHDIIKQAIDQHNAQC